MTSINGDMGVRVRVDTGSMGWQPSPSGHVLRKRVHLVGAPESGQVTSVVRYEPGASFPAHEHPEGEEILVLEGVFSDEHGDWPSGSYLLNPEGFRHAPFSRDGCLLFVKLRQYGGEGRRHVSLQTHDARWTPSDREGVSVKVLYRGHGEEMRLERWAVGAGSGAGSGATVHPGGAEILVLDGALEDEAGRHAAGVWLRLPAGASHRPSSSEGCELYVKTGGVSSLRSA